MQHHICWRSWCCPSSWFDPSTALPKPKYEHINPATMLITAAARADMLAAGGPEIALDVELWTTEPA